MEFLFRVSLHNIIPLLTGGIYFIGIFIARNFITKGNVIEKSERYILRHHSREIMVQEKQ